MTITTTERTARRKRTIVGSVAAGLGVLALALGASLPAQAAGTVGTINVGHVDGLHVALNTSNNQLVLGSNVDEDDYLAGSSFDPGYYTRSEVNAAFGTPAYDFTVPHANYNLDPINFPNKWLLPKDEPALSLSGPLYLGIAGTGEDLVKHGTTSPVVVHSLYDGILAGKHVTFKIVLASAPSGGHSTIPSASGSGTSSSPWQFTYTLPAGPNDEPIHQHFNWTFDTAGVYKFTVTASTDQAGITAASAITYQFTVQ